MRTSRLIGSTTATLVMLALVAWSATASAQSSAGDTKEIILSPYIWGTSLSGTSTVGVLPPVDVDASFSDLFSNLNIALAMHTSFTMDDGHS